MFRDDPCMIYLGAVDEDGYAQDPCTKMRNGG